MEEPDSGFHAVGVLTRSPAWEYGWKFNYLTENTSGAEKSEVKEKIPPKLSLIHILRPMTEYQKTYIELKKQFVATNEGPDSVRALYTFKEELEQSEDQQAKEVLVDVYDLLDFKKDAYELLCQIGNRSDKKTLKRLGTLKEYAENWGNHYALPKPKTPEEKQKEKERQAQLGMPAFRYHPNPLETGAFEESTDGVVCDCCGKTTHIFYTNPFFSVEDLSLIHI